MDPTGTNPPPDTPIRRKRRPWWRWNLTVLAAVLFVALWSRELMTWHFSTTWWIASSLLAVWLLAPVPFVQHERTKRLPPVALLRTSQMLKAQSPPLTLFLFRYGGLISAIFGALYFCALVVWSVWLIGSGSLPFNFLSSGVWVWQAVWCLSLPLLSVVGGGSLYTLTLIAERLLGPAQQMPANSLQATQPPRSIE